VHAEELNIRVEKEGDNKPPGPRLPICAAAPKLAWIDVLVSKLSRRKKDMWIPWWLAVHLQGKEWGGKTPLQWNKNVGKQTLTGLAGWRRRRHRAGGMHDNSGRKDEIDHTDTHFH
jgi:hypothetical protein